MRAGVGGAVGVGVGVCVETLSIFFVSNSYAGVE